jgi:hypothetical protein
MVWSVLVSLFRSRVSLEAGILILRHQLNIQRRHQSKRLAFSAIDRLIFVGLYRLVPNTIKALTIHEAGYRDPLAPRRFRVVLDAGNRGTAAADQLHRWKFAGCSAPWPAADPVVWGDAHPTAEWIANQLTEACGWEPSLLNQGSRSGGLALDWPRYSEKGNCFPRSPARPARPSQFPAKQSLLDVVVKVELVRMWA